jgi:uncharacterized lipoprotein YehR (DUF1307 family)
MNVFLAVQFAAFCKQDTRIKFIESSWQKIEYAELRLVMEDAMTKFIESIESSWRKIEYAELRLMMEDAMTKFIESIESSWRKIEYRGIKTGDGRSWGCDCCDCCLGSEEQ